MIIRPNFTNLSTLYFKSQFLNQRATGGSRTRDPPLTKRLLYQLSYGGV